MKTNLVIKDKTIIELGYCKISYGGGLRGLGVGTLSCLKLARF